MVRSWRRCVIVLPLMALPTLIAGLPHPRPVLANDREAEKRIESRSEVVLSPHAPGARHPKEVARIMKLLPGLPATGSLEEFERVLGLPEAFTGGHASSTGFDLYWDIVPGYRFELSFGPERRDDGTLELAEAGFSAQNRPGFPPDEHHTIYPYRTSKGMVSK